MSMRGTSGVEIRFPGSTEALDVTPFVRRFLWRESMIEGGFTWEIQLATNFWEEWDNLILGREDPQFRLYFQRSDGTQDSTGWKTAVPDRSVVGYRSTALTFSVVGSDKRLNLSQLNRTRAWPASTVSEVIRDIGSEYGFDVLTERTTSRKDRWQSREFDWPFMARLARSTSSGAGRGDMYLWLDEDQLCFQSPQLQNASERRHVMQEVENRVDRVVLAYQGREVDRQGGATLRGVGFDLDTKAAKVFTLDSGQASSLPALARRVPRVQADGLRVMASVSTSATDLEEVVRGRWGKLAPRYFSLRLDTRPDLVIKPATVVELQGTLGTSQDTPLLGRFAVLEVQHLLTAGDPKDKHSGGLVTTVVGYRREAYAGDDEPTGAAVSQAGTRDRYRLGQEPTPSTTVIAEAL
jgi:hypothetical protein